MPLVFPPKWRFTPPSFGEEDEPQISSKAVGDFEVLIKKIGGQKKPWDTLEHFKIYFARAGGSTASGSSSEDWAETDLWNFMVKAGENAPLFIEAFHDACESLAKKGFGVPDVNMVNKILRKRRIPFELDPPRLRLRSDSAAPAIVNVPAPPPTLAENARALLDRSVARAHELLGEGRGTEAVREVLWLLESIATGFKGLAVAGTKIEGSYFNEIATELRRARKHSHLEQVLKWTESLHGYLSSPTGGGIRHGIDLNAGRPLTEVEARLFVNLVFSYLNYFLAEHEGLSSGEVT